ncbi:MAG: tetratricopeptide repeat protein [Lysobacterales bacterium]
MAELKRRNVLRAAALYAAGAWALAQGIAQLAPVAGLSDWVARWFLVATLIGFPFWIAFAWFYEFTPEGLKRESEISPGDSIAHSTSRKLDFAIIGALAIAVVLLLTNQFVLRRDATSVADSDAIAPAAIPTIEQDPSIAVLPLVNTSEDKNNEYFSDGISEELLNLLAKVPKLRVIARTSSFAFKGKEVAIPEIARALNVAAILEGSVRKSGNTVRITMQLVRATDGSQLWSETYDRNLDDIFKVQDEIASAVVDKLKITLLDAAPKSRSTDPQAYALFLQASQLAQQKTAEAFAKSDGHYRQVLAIDPRYAPAWIGLANNVISKMGLGLISGNQGYVDAKAAGEKALEIEPDQASAHTALGRIAAYQGDLTTAGRQFERALAIDPADLSALGGAALLLQSLGRLDQSLELNQAIVRRDPVNVRALYNLGTDQAWAGRFDEAIASFRTVLNLSPERSGAHAAIGQVLLLKGDARGALAEIEQETSELWRLLGLTMVHHALGHKADSDDTLSALIAGFEKEAPYNIAYVYAFRGEADKAFEWLGKAGEYGDPGLSEIVTEILFDKIHEDPRWLPFLRGIGKAPEQLAMIKFTVALPK